MKKKVTDGQSRILNFLKDEQQYSPTEIGIGAGIKASNASSWACKLLKPMCDVKLIKRHYKKLKGKRAEVTYSIMAKGRKALEKGNYNAK